MCVCVCVKEIVLMYWICVRLEVRLLLRFYSQDIEEGKIERKTRSVKTVFFQRTNSLSFQILSFESSLSPTFSRADFSVKCETRLFEQRIAPQRTVGHFSDIFSLSAQKLSRDEFTTN